MMAFRAMACATYPSSTIVGDAACAIWATWIQKIDSGTSIRRFMTNLHFAHLVVLHWLFPSFDAHGLPLTRISHHYTLGGTIKRSEVICGEADVKATRASR